MSKLLSIMLISHVTSFRWSRISYYHKMHSKHNIMRSVSNEIQSCTCLSFFKFFHIDNCDEFVSNAQLCLSDLNVKGTLYVAREGVNGQFAVPTESLTDFYSTIKSIHTDMIDLDINMGETVSITNNTNNLPFRKLLIKQRNQVLTDKLEIELDVNDCGPEIEPSEWHEKVQETKSLVLDCRNGYETEWGNFTNSIPLNTETFSESWKVLQETLQDTPKDTQILTYCTGGIRCVKVNAFLKQRLGFTNVLRLKKGIIAYEKWVCENKTAGVKSTFIGKNYLFDRRREYSDDDTSGRSS